MELNSIGQPATPTSTPTEVRATEITKNLGVNQPRRPRLGRLRLILTVLVAVLILALLGPLGYMFWQLFNGQASPGQQQSDSTYDITTIPLDDLVKGQDISTAVNQQVNINGRLRINNSFVLTPSDVPADPLLGQFYLNQQNTQLYYYNGVEFVDLATGTQLGQLESQLGQAVAVATQLQTQVNSLGSTSIDASNINNGTLGDAYLSQNVALLDRSNQVFVGGSQVFRNSSNSAAAFTVQNAAGQNSLVVDTTSQRVAVGAGATPATSALTVGTNTTSAAGGITLGTDTNLYRAGANTLKTDGNLQVGQFGAFGNTGAIRNSGAAQVLLDTSHRLTSTAGLTNFDAANIRLNINEAGDSTIAATGNYSEVMINQGGNFNGWGYAGYNYIENNATGNANDLNGSVSHAWNFSNGNLVIGTGQSALYQADAGTTDWGYGARSYVSAGALTGTGSITNAIGTNSRVENLGNGTITNGYGMLIQSATNSGGGNFTNNYGLYLQDQSGVGSANSYNLYSAGSAGSNLIEGRLEVGRAVAIGDLGALGDTGTDRSSLNVGQSYSDLSGINNLSSMSSSLEVTATANTGAAILGSNNAVSVGGNNNYSGPIITNYSYAEKSGGGTAHSLVAAEGDAYHLGTGTVSYGAGVYGYYSDSSAGGTSVRGYGLWGEVYGFDNGNIQNAAGVAVTVQNDGAGTFTNGYGVLVQAAGNTGGGSFLNNYGVYIQDQSGTGSSNSYNLYSAGAASNNLIEGGLRVQGATLLRNSSNSTTSFQVQNASGTPLLTADTTNMTITIQALQVTGNLTVNGHIITGGSTPSTAVNANAGVGATCVASGTDTAGTITITTGSSAVVAGTQCTVTFAAAFGAAPRVVVGPSNAAAAPLDPYVGSTATNNFTVGVGTAGATSTQYRFDYVAAQ